MEYVYGVAIFLEVDLRNPREDHYFKIGKMIVISGVLLILFQQAVVHIGVLYAGVSTIVSILMPFIVGLVMAYLLCPVYNVTVRKSYSALSSKMQNKKRAFSIARVAGSIVAVIVLLGAIAGFIALIFPELLQSLVKLVDTLPMKINRLDDFATGLTSHIQDEKTAMAVNDFIEHIQERALKLAQETFAPSLGAVINKISAGVIFTMRAMLNLLIGMIVAVYFLNSKETFKAQSKKLIMATTSRKVADEIFNFGNFTNRTFGGFINGKIIDSLIIGIICFIAMTIFRMPYSALVSTIIGVTNIIPFFGPFIGAIPGAIIVAFVDPIQALYFLIMVFVLQQFDGNILGPAILGGKTGLASFWVMFAIILGGGLFGFVGMILGVPVFAIICYYADKAIKKRLARKELPVETDDYKDFNQYDINGKEIL